ncbi:MAG: helicase [Mesorhizobium sp.]
MSIEHYRQFLDAKRMADPATGIPVPRDLPDYLFPHQRDITRWALRRGRAAIFAGTGLGKTLMELVWAREVATFTKKPVLLLAPLSVAHQHAREAGSFGIDARVVHQTASGDVQVSNYQKLSHFDLSGFGGIALDESSILKSYDGHFRNMLIDAAAPLPFRLAATATPAPNDFMELGNHAEFLGVMSYTDMLATFFVHDSSDTRVWRLKGHAEDDFWRWMASWAVMLRKPSDLGYPDDGYDLPPLIKRPHVVETGTHVNGDGLYSLFPVLASTMQERRSAARDTVGDRIALAASITPTDEPYVWWCNLNAESEGLARTIPGAVEVSGSMTDGQKESRIEAFNRGEIRVLVTKPSICGFGMNWQHCCRTGFAGLNDSFEQVYQSVRRFWRFGQKRPVIADFIHADTEGAVIANLDRKERDAERMAAAMVRHMADLSAETIRGSSRDVAVYAPTKPVILPAWEEFS